jgi:hypothetical protein
MMRIFKKKTGEDRSSPPEELESPPGVPEDLFEDEPKAPVAAPKQKPLVPPLVSGTPTKGKDKHFPTGMELQPGISKEGAADPASLSPMTVIDPTPEKAGVSGGSEEGVKRWKLRSEARVSYNGTVVIMKAGKIIDSRYYDVEQLKKQKGVVLDPV